MEPVPFEKMHGCGNDFVVLDGRRAPIPLTPAVLRRIGDRHRGVGFDQLLLIERDDDDDAKLRFFNTDGSESGACGNGTRCVARFLFDEGAAPRLRLVVGERRLAAELLPDGRIAVVMGEPVLDWQQIPLATACDTLEVPLDVPGLPRPVAVGLGNPHLVFLVPDLAPIDVESLGAKLEHHPILPERGNIGFAQLTGPDRLRLRVFERGAGLTLTYGSGFLRGDGRGAAAGPRGRSGAAHPGWRRGRGRMAGRGAGDADRANRPGLQRHAGAGAVRCRLTLRS